MISTKIIKTIKSKVPKDENNKIYLNVLTWHDENHINGSKYHVFSPYNLKTDGKEDQHNGGSVLFENFWQGSKVWKNVYDIQIWAHPNLKGVSNHKWFEYTCDNKMGVEIHYNNFNKIEKKYYEWRDEIWNCAKPIRYPNGFKKQKDVLFCLYKDKMGIETKLNFIESRKQIYLKEYCRLIRNLDLYKELLNLLNNDFELVICEIDVLDNKVLDLELLEKMIVDDKIKFGHGLCLAYALLNDFCKQN